MARAAGPQHHGPAQRLFQGGDDGVLNTAPLIPRRPPHIPMDSFSRSLAGPSPRGAGEADRLLAFICSELSSMAGQIDASGNAGLPSPVSQAQTKKLASLAATLPPQERGFLASWIHRGNLPRLAYDLEVGTSAFAELLATLLAATHSARAPSTRDSTATVAAITDGVLDQIGAAKGTKLFLTGTPYRWALTLVAEHPLSLAASHVELATAVVRLADASILPALNQAITQAVSNGQDAFASVCDQLAMTLNLYLLDNQALQSYHGLIRWAGGPGGQSGEVQQGFGGPFPNMPALLLGVKKLYLNLDPQGQRHADTNARAAVQAILCNMSHFRDSMAAIAATEVANAGLSHQGPGLLPFLADMGRAKLFQYWAQAGVPDHYSKKTVKPALQVAPAIAQAHTPPPQAPAPSPSRGNYARPPQGQPQRHPPAWQAVCNVPADKVIEKWGTVWAAGTSKILVGRSLFDGCSAPGCSSDGMFSDHQNVHHSIRKNFGASSASGPHTVAASVSLSDSNFINVYRVVGLSINGTAVDDSDAIFDTCASTSFVVSDEADRLGLERRPSQLQVVGWDCAVSAQPLEEADVTMAVSSFPQISVLMTVQIVSNHLLKKAFGASWMIGADAGMALNLVSPSEGPLRPDRVKACPSVSSTCSVTLARYSEVVPSPQHLAVALGDYPADDSDVFRVPRFPTDSPTSSGLRASAGLSSCSTKPAAAPVRALASSVDELAQLSEDDLRCFREDGQAQAATLHAVLASAGHQPGGTVFLPTIAPADTSEIEFNHKTHVGFTHLTEVLRKHGFEPSPGLSKAGAGAIGLPEICLEPTSDPWFFKVLTLLNEYADENDALGFNPNFGPCLIHTENHIGPFDLNYNLGVHKMSPANLKVLWEFIDKRTTEGSLCPVTLGPNRPVHTSTQAAFIVDGKRMVVNGRSLSAVTRTDMTVPREVPGTTSSILFLLEALMNPTSLVIILDLKSCFNYQPSTFDTRGCHSQADIEELVFKVLNDPARNFHVPIVTAPCKEGLETRTFVSMALPQGGKNSSREAAGNIVRTLKHALADGVSKVVYLDDLALVVEQARRTDGSIDWQVIYKALTQLLAALLGRPITTPGSGPVLSSDVGLGVRVNLLKMMVCVEKISYLGAELGPSGASIPMETRSLLQSMASRKVPFPLKNLSAVMAARGVLVYWNWTSPMGILLRTVNAGIGAKLCPSKCPPEVTEFLYREPLRHAADMLLGSPPICSLSKDRSIPVVIFSDASAGENGGTGAALATLDYVPAIDPITKKLIFDPDADPTKGNSSSRISVVSSIGWSAKPEERKMPAVHLEILGIGKALSYYAPLCDGRPIILASDAKSVVLMLNSDKPVPPTVVRALDVISRSGATLIHCPGVLNTIADLRSRACPKPSPAVEAYLAEHVPKLKVADFRSFEYSTGIELVASGTDLNKPGPDGSPLSRAPRAPDGGVWADTAAGPLHNPPALLCPMVTRSKVTATPAANSSSGGVGSIPSPIAPVDQTTSSSTTSSSESPLTETKDDFAELDPLYHEAQFRSTDLEAMILGLEPTNEFNSSFGKIADIPTTPWRREVYTSIDGRLHVVLPLDSFDPANSYCSGKTKKQPDLEDIPLVIGHFHRTGHSGSEAMLRAMQDVGFSWPSMRRDLSAHVDCCIICRAANQGAPKLATRHALSGTTVKPHCIVYADHTYMQGAEASGSFVGLLLTIMDIFSGFILAVPARGTDSTSVLRDLGVLLPAMGPVTTLISDHGFMAEATREGLKRHFNIEGLTHGVPGNPFQIAPLEKQHKAIHNLMRKLLGGDLARWTDMLPTILRTINFTPRESLGGLCPAQLHFGLNVDMSPAADDAVDRFRQLMSSSDLTVTQSLRDLKQLADGLVTLMVPTINRIHRERAARLANARSGTGRLSGDLTGEFVMIEKDPRGKDDFYYEPRLYRVSSDGGFGKLHIVDTAGQPLSRVYSVSEVRHVSWVDAIEILQHSGEAGAQAIELAELSRQGTPPSSQVVPALAEWSISRVVGHADHPSLGRFYKIRWEGFSAKDDSWVHFTNLRGHSAIGAYNSKFPPPFLTLPLIELFARSDFIALVQTALRVAGGCESLLLTDPLLWS